MGTTSGMGPVDLSGDVRGERGLLLGGLGRGDRAGREGRIDFRVAVSDHRGDQAVTRLARGGRDLSEGLARLELGIKVGLGRADVGGGGGARFRLRLATST